MAIPEVKTEVSEGLYMVYVEGASPREPKDKGSAPAATRMLNPIFSLSR